VLRTSGSHRRLVHKTDPKRQTTVALHKEKDMPHETLESILKQRQGSRMMSLWRCCKGEQLRGQ
jgi:predicted RNA binding protein YcfA (HicA-like mRNA interferase family)